MILCLGVAVAAAGVVVAGRLDAASGAGTPRVGVRERASRFLTVFQQAAAERERELRALVGESADASRADAA